MTSCRFVTAAIAAAAIAVCAGAPAARAEGAPAAQAEAAPVTRADGATLRRFSLIIGANDGGADRVTLRYAGSDASAMARVVSELGGVQPGDVSVLLDPSTDDLDAAFAALERRLTAARVPNARIELIVYYSGHSDDEGLLLAGHRYRYERLRDQVRAMPADVNIAILDSCASGAFTRAKGGRHRPAFLVDTSNQVSGHAFLSSSSADEAAQESDRIRASFFTHYLVSGLRGGADSNRDGRVTLNEAYQFAYGETVSRTRSSQHGAQHPAYDMHLAGTGDVVMTDLRATSAALVLSAEIAGRLYVHDSSGRLVVELNKAAGAPLLLGLGPDDYQIVLHAGERRYRATVHVDGGQRVTLAFGGLEPFEGEPTVARGGADPRLRDYRTRSAHVAFVPGLSTSGTGAFEETHIVSLNILAGGGAALEGFEVGGILNMRRDWVRGVQLAGIGNLAGGYTRGLQVAGIGNWTGGDAEVLRIGGIGNWTGGDFRGLDVGGIANWVNGSVRGLQLGGIANVAGGNVRGAQISGIANIAGDRVRGAQISLVNIGGDVDGAQIGLLNIARHVDGMQLGLVNVAKRNDGAPIGLINAISEGHRAIEAWTSDVARATVGVKFGSHHVYSLLAVGATDDYLLAGAGIGIHAPRRLYYADIDLASYMLFDHDFGEAEWNQLAQLRAMVGIPIASHLSVFAGVQLSALLDYDGTPGDDVFPLASTTYMSTDVTATLSPGFFAGISY